MATVVDYSETLQKELAAFEELESSSCEDGESDWGSPRMRFFYVLQVRGVEDECLQVYVNSYLGSQGVLRLIQREFRNGQQIVSDALAKVASRVSGKLDVICNKDYCPELDILEPVPHLEGAATMLKNAVLRAAYRLPPLAIDRQAHRGADWLRYKLLDAYARMWHPTGFVATACANQRTLTMHDLIVSRCCPVKIILPVLSAEGPEMKVHRDAMFAAIRMKFDTAQWASGGRFVRLQLPPGYQFPSTAAAHELVASGCVAVNRNRFGTGEDWVAVLRCPNVHSLVRLMVTRWVRTSHGGPMTIQASIRDELHQPTAEVPLAPKILSSSVVSELERLTRDVRDPPHEFEKLSQGNLALLIKGFTGELCDSHEPAPTLVAKLADAVNRFVETPDEGDPSTIDLAKIAARRRYV